MEVGTASTELLRAYHLLCTWLDLVDRFPIHDLLDRIYFEGDLLRRYAATVPTEQHETVRANLQALIEIALNVDAGRYPSLPRFLAKIRELREAEGNESPDEGRVGEVGNAVRIYYDSVGTWNDQDAYGGFQALHGGEWVDWSYWGYPWQLLAFEYATSDGVMAYVANSNTSTATYSAPAYKQEYAYVS